jgi:hypothetical protein
MLNTQMHHHAGAKTRDTLDDVTNTERLGQADAAPYLRRCFPLLCASVAMRAPMAFFFKQVSGKSGQA